jgi:hypothetical protein
MQISDPRVEMVQVAPGILYDKKVGHTSEGCDYRSRGNKRWEVVFCTLPALHIDGVVEIPAEVFVLASSMPVIGEAIEEAGEGTA